MSDPLQPAPILQSALRQTPWQSPATARLPGTGPVSPGDWLPPDDAFAPQMALRERLIQERPEEVHALLPEAEGAARELLSRVMTEVSSQPAFSVRTPRVTRPDGQVRTADPATPLLSLGKLTQQDFCILQKQGDEHVLTGAILCFPASWTLAEKIGRPLTTIHTPVAPYTPDLARRVQRLFDAVHPDRPLWRVNLLLYADPALHQPRRENDPRSPGDSAARFVRSERQCICRLPESDSVVFSIHTTVVELSKLSNDVSTQLLAYLSEKAH